MNLSILIGIPVATAVSILLLGSTTRAKWVALVGALAQLVAVGALLMEFQQTRKAGEQASYLFQQDYPWFPSLGIHWHLGVDGIAVTMLALTSLVVVAGVLVSWLVEERAKDFFFQLTLLSVGAYGFFMSLDFFLLFFFLELAVIPKYLLIGIWGSGDKVRAANKLALMLMAGSAFILIGMLAMYAKAPDAGFSLLRLAEQPLAPTDQRWIFILLFAGFGVFTALFPFHTWVPDGHSSAPTAGSMFLAGISMKLGGYGCLRIATQLLPDGAQAYADWIIVLAGIAVVYGAFATMLQDDLKYMNAYSSISHCGFVILGIGMMGKTAAQGAVLQMISHGLMTALFFAVIGMIYTRTHTRKMREMGGLMKVMPVGTTLLFLAGLCSLGLPGLSGFVAEMTILVGAWENPSTLARVATIAAAGSIVVTAVYILQAVGRTAMGPLRAEHAHVKDIRWFEQAAAVVLLAGILLMGLAPYVVTDLLHVPAAGTVQAITITR